MAVSVRATCTRCRRAILTTCSLPLAERDVEALTAHVHTCNRIRPTERSPGGAFLGDVLFYFDINIS